MKVNDINLTKVFFILSSFLMLAVWLIRPESEVTIWIVGALSIVSLYILDIKIPMLIIIVTLFLTMLLPMQTIFSDRVDRLLLAELISMFVIVLGKMPNELSFNSYFGLGLPWNKRAQDTWDNVHKVLAYLSLPIAILQLTFILFLDSESIIPISVLTWILIPSLYSLRVYSKKRV